MSERAEICPDCLRPKATKEQWANDHGDGNGCECPECVSVCWGDYAYCKRVAQERAAKANPALLARYRAALEAIATYDYESPEELAIVRLARAALGKE